MAMPPQTVFVSSTCYDLIDLRAELRAFLVEHGLRPLLSEHPEFGAEPDRNSIETCLVKLEESDVVLCIIGARYGGKLAKAGYSDLSATHLEYKRALELGKSLHLFVRDTTLGAYSIWRQHGRAVGDYLPVRSPDAERVFPWLEEHQKLHKSSEHNNWVSSFKDSVELRERVQHLLKSSLQRKVIDDAISSGTLPLLSVNASVRSSSPREHHFVVIAMNVARYAIFDVRFIGGHSNMKGEIQGRSRAVPPSNPVAGDFRETMQRRSWPYLTTMKIEFKTTRGLVVRETFQVEVQPGDDYRVHLLRVELVEGQEFAYGPAIPK